MTEVFIAVLIVAAIGLIAGIILSAASVALWVPVDKKQQQIRDCLPGANCGACGYSGCDGYASALAKGTAEQGLCTPGGNDTAQSIAKILGTDAVSVKKVVAAVKCNGSCNHTDSMFVYQGVKTCATANQLFSGGGKCSFSCIGLGDCAAVCTEDAINISDGIASVDRKKCKGCGRCVSACPKGIVELVGINSAFVSCSSKDKGAVTRKNCTAGCIGCMMCAKNCEVGAVTVENNLAHINSNICTGCGKCVSVCKMNCISVLIPCS